MAKKRSRIVVAIAVVTSVAGAGLVLSPDAAGASDGAAGWSSVPAVSDVRGITAPNVLSLGLTESAVAQGSLKLENPTPEVPYYGYLGNGSLVPDPAIAQAPGVKIEASKTDPDKNTYLKLPGQHGADKNYDYGKNFLYQGHEMGGVGVITRINLDADQAHRVTLLASKQADGSALPTLDGSTWDPWAKRLLFTAENGNVATVVQATPDINSKVQDVSFVTGRGGYEGIQNDSAGNLWIVEDIGGSTVGTKAKNPNSFVYRLIPYDKHDLTKGGKLQALQVVSRRTGSAIGYQNADATHPNGGAFSDDMKDLANYGPSLTTHWVTIHDTKVDTSGKAFDANALAKAASATPFKRPENGQFRPGTDFREFYFDATGDTNTDSSANDGYGGYGTVYKLTQSDPTSDDGKLSVFYAGDKAHTGLDNVTFLDRTHVAFVEDAGDTLHAQRNALDSGYVFDTSADYSGGTQPVRFLAEGRDPSATLDNMLAGVNGGTQNDGDNEITGIHASDGDASTGGILGAKVPTLFRNGWRLFWNQQHGDNYAWEITPADK
ncbi:phosphatase [Actinacidiphila soli]|uniref:phosphatase n=1 Tax=Actinacidiphila soli TaxID=2487275 RepID=UPI000FC9CC67|nr:phosphatase [Actinacidiphila soli]